MLIRAVLLILVLLFCASPVQALVEPEVEAWQKLVKELDEGFGPFLPVGDAAQEFGEFGSSLAAAPFSDLMSELEQRRGLKFQYFTPWHVKNKTQFSLFIKEELAKEYTPEKVIRDEALLKVLGLVPLDFQLLEFYGDLLTDAVAGVYVPDTDQFFLIDMEKGQGIKERLAGKAIEQLVGDSSTAIIIHELDHALGAQHFSFKETFAKLTKSATMDQQLAIMALVEGDATFVMMDHQNKRPPFKGGSETVVAGADMIADIMSKFPGFLPGMSKYSEAPLFFQRSLIFPYFGGAEFVSSLRMTGDQTPRRPGAASQEVNESSSHDEIVKSSAEGWASVNRVYSELPHSTEQMFHPFRYIYLNRKPAQIDLSGIPQPFGEWAKVHDEIGGEFLVRVVLEQYGVSNYRDAADGWHGDKIRVFRNKKTGGLGFYWVIAWDNQRDADEFYNSLGSHLPFVVEREGMYTFLSLAFDEKALSQLRKGIRASSPKPGAPPSARI